MRREVQREVQRAAVPVVGPAAVPLGQTEGWVEPLELPVVAGAPLEAVLVVAMVVPGDWTRTALLVCSWEVGGQATVGVVRLVWLYGDL